MKVTGIILLIFGILNLIGSVLLFMKAPEQMGTKLFMAIGFIGGGYYLISRSNQKKRERRDQDKWMHGEE